MKKMLFGLAAACLLLSLPIACTQTAVPTGTGPGAPPPVSTPCSSCGLTNYNLVKTWNTNLSGPWGIAISDSKVYVIDYSNSDVVVFDKTGKYLFTFGNSGAGALYYPYGGRIRNNMLYVADYSNYRIAKYDLNGNYLGQIYYPSGTFLGYPNDVAVDAGGNVYSAGGYYGTYKISPQNTILIQYNGSHLSYAGGIALDASNNVVVMDYYNGIVKYSNSGTYLSTVNNFSGQTFSGPYFLAIDPISGQIFVSDYSNNAIYRGDANNKLTAYIGSGTLSSQGQVAEDTDGALYVANYSNGNVAVFAPGTQHGAH